jgi:hypothetical protein
MLPGMMTTKTSDVVITSTCLRRVEDNAPYHRE